MPEPPPSPTTTSQIEPGALVGGRYRLVARVAEGGMAEVWEAVDEVLTRPVAVKILLPHLVADTAFVTRFRREAIAAARLSDPHIVSVYDTCSDAGVEAIVMELVRGTTLRRLLDERGRLPAPQAVHIAVQIADALHHAHACGLIHRDVKPGNILLSDDDRVLVADFGIAKAAEASADLTEVGQVVGTAKYLSPEQVAGAPLDARSDVYALGVVLYEMVCGRAPFTGRNATTTAMARLTSDPMPMRQVCGDVPPALEQVVLRAMARQPEDRFASAAELRGALARLDLGADATVVRPAAGRDDATTVAPTDRRAGREHRPRPAPGRPAGRSPGPGRPWVVPTALVVVIAATLAVVGVLLARTELGRGVFGGGGDGNRPPAAGAGSGVAITSVRSFDPFGQGGEHDNELAGLLDDLPDTAWTTEEYRRRDLGGLKPGVGLVLTLARATELDALAVTSPTRNWAASVYVADTAPSDLDGWGQPVTSQEGIAGDVTFDLAGRRGAAVLLWITDLGEGAGGRFTTAITSVRLEG
ncbi:MAG: protein kinase [Actinobacteria bacterium]|nr:protein kinase [Actinomycetota bacterium]